MACLLACVLSARMSWLAPPGKARKLKALFKDCDLDIEQHAVMPVQHMQASAAGVQADVEFRLFKQPQVGARSPTNKEYASSVCLIFVERFRHF